MRVPRLPEAKLCAVLRLVTTQDESGGDIEDWQPSGTTFKAEIWPLQGNQSRGEMGVTEKSTHKAFSADPGAFESNTRLVDTNDNIYLVGYVQDWISHREAVLEYVGRSEERGP